MRMGVIADLHLGLEGRTVYHNRLLGDRAVSLGEAAVAVLNRAGADLVVVLGDISNGGLRCELEQARRILDALRMPWFALPGNHDAAAARDGVFEDIFGEHAAAGNRCGVDAAILFVHDADPASSPASTSFLVGPRQTDDALAAAGRDRSDALIVCAHGPLASAASAPVGHSGAYAGHFRDGAEFLERLAERVAPRRPLALCGHLHFHHVLATPRWVQVATAALIEYPMEARLVTVQGGSASVETLPVASPTVQAESLLSVKTTWVAGRPEDRRWEGVLRANP